MGGTSPDYASYIEYCDNDGMVTDFFAPLSSSEYVCGKDLAGISVDVYEGSAIMDLWQVDLSVENSVYIVTATNKSSSVEGGTSVLVLGYVDGKIAKKPIARANYENAYSIDTSYYIPDWYFTTDGLGWDWLINYDKETGALYVAEETEDKVLNDRYDMYKFEKGVLRYVGTDAGYWLHPSLHNFKRLCGIYQTENKLIRIDQLNDGTYRYAAWNKNKDMSDTPELIIGDGQTGIVENVIVFCNGDYTYVVPEYRRGHGDDFGKMMIKHGDKVIQETDV